MIMKKQLPPTVKVILVTFVGYIVHLLNAPSRSWAISKEERVFFGTYDRSRLLQSQNIIFTILYFVSLK